MKVLRFILFLFLLFHAAFAQKLGNLYEKKIPLSTDTISLDTLSIIPSSFILKASDGKIMDSALYHLNAAKALLALKKEALATSSNDSIIVVYRTFPYYFGKTVKHKDIQNIRPNAQGRIDPFAYTASPKQEDIFAMEGLNKNGSISRGISFGNSQDVVVNSNLNLQVSGKLSNNIDILLAATDNNIPFQPDGNTQQLQDFDKVFIQLSDQKSKLIAGDFQTFSSTSYFMKFNKKAQGLNFSTLFNPEKNDTATNFLTASAAVSRGKFARNLIAGVESNQGPYRLTGAENEPFIIVLSGTERIYIDGELLQRGQENDYIINYNTAEITFTPKRLITKDKRIVAEFQYSDKNYARSLIHFGDEYKNKNVKLYFQAYSEQDSKNQPLQQELSNEQKKLLINIGDTLNKALTPGIDSIAFNSSEVLYQKQDSVIGTNLFSSVYVYSTDVSKANFRLTFSNMGAGNGNYIQVNSSANGRVFKWVMPDTITGAKQGSYEPVILLIPPRKKQMLVGGGEYTISKTNKILFEAAMSNNDINTFSSKNSNDDVGYALKLGFTDVTNLRNADTTNNRIKAAWKLKTDFNYELTQKYFSPIERFRSIEFERDWNRLGAVTQNDQHIGGGAVSFIRNTLPILNYNFNYFATGNNYNAYKHLAGANYNDKKYVLKADGSFLQSKDILYNTAFLRHNATIARKFKWVNIGFNELHEKNLFTNNNSDTIANNSYEFFGWDTYISNGDTLKNTYLLSYGQRMDYAAKNNRLNAATFAENISASIGLLRNSNSQLNITATYRKLTIKDNKLTTVKPDNSLLGRIEHNGKFIKGVIATNTFYEVGSGLEVKKEFSFLEVAPGKGSYSWTDYNNNGVQELNEFEVAVFTDQAKYIKVFTPTNDYIKTYSNQFSQMLNLKPGIVGGTKKGFKKIIALFSNQTAYKIDRKTTNSEPLVAYNPFLQGTADSSLVTLNSSLRNTIYFNQNNTVFGADFSWQDNRNKSLLVNGLESRYNTFKEIRSRWNMTKSWSIFFNYKAGNKFNFSEFFASRNYRVIYKEIEPKLSYQPNTSFRTSLSFKHTEKSNNPDYGLQKAILQDYGVEIKYNILSKGSLNLKSNYINISYNDDQNNSLAFEMLDGLKAGRNITWGASYQRTLANNMQVNFGYEGRKPESLKAIHTGNAQVRVFF